jgi:maltooligosyltrehalose trehalohydrolase
MTTDATGSDPMTTFELWAPAADRVDLLVGTQAGGIPDRADDHTVVPMRRDGEHWRAEAAAPAGTRYAFSLDGGDPRPDPRGLRLPDGPHGWSATADLAAYPWTDHDWAGAPLEGAVIYELHIGTFTESGTLDSAVERLDHLVDLGVTVVELLPLSPFPGTHGWGYDGVAPWAVHEPYGGPEALQRFVDAAHRRGLGVALDLVYNHLGPDGNHLAELGPYLTDKHATPWGSAVNLDAPGSDGVRAWILDNVALWFRDFHVDGLRLDAVHELHDHRAVHILEEMAALTDTVAAEVGRPLWLVAESDRNDPGTVTPRGEAPAVGGTGIHGQWVDDVHHALHVALTGETQGYYADFTDASALAKVMRSPFFHDGTYSTFRGRSHGRPVDPRALPGWRFVASLQTHDQIGNRAVGDRLSALVDTDGLACGAAMLLAAPWTPMLFMGEEWGATTPWQFFTDHTDPAIAEATRQGRRAEFGAHGWDEAEVPDPQDPETVRRSRLDWSEPGRGDHARLLGWYRDLIALRRRTPDLSSGDLTRAAADRDAEARRLDLRRGDHRVLVNLGAQDWETGEASDGSTEVLLAWQPESAVSAASATTVPARGVVVLRVGEAAGR